MNATGRAVARLKNFLLVIAVALGCGGSSGTTNSATSCREARSHEAAPQLPWLSAHRPGPTRTPSVVVIRGGRVLTAAGQIFDPGTVVLADGRIRAIGADADVVLPHQPFIPIDATGKVVTPGIIDVHSHMGVYAAPGVDAHEDGNEMTSPTTPEVRARDSFWPQDPALARAIMAGVTTIQILPGSANLIGGQGEILKLHLSTGVEAMRFPGAPPTLKMACGENPKRVYGERNTAPQTRMGNVAGYRRAFQAAREYGATFTRWQREYERWQNKQARSECARTAGDADAGAENEADLPPAMPERDLGKETLLRLLNGEVLLQMHCYRADEMLTMLEIAREFGFTVTAFHHAVEAYKIREQLAAAHTSIATWPDWWGFKLEAFDAIPENVALLAEANVNVVMHSDSADLVQRLNQEAAKAMHWGRAAGIEVTEDHALQWITKNAANAIGVGAQTGTLEVGKMADVVIWNGNPLSVYARVERVFIDGVAVYEQSAPFTTDFEAGQTMPTDLWSGGGITPWQAQRDVPVRVPQQGDALTAQTTLILNVQLLNGDGTTTDGANVLVRGHRIVSVSTSVPQLPAATPTRTISARNGAVSMFPGVPEAVRIDGTGMVLTPGFIALDSPIGLMEVDLERSTDDASPNDEADMVRASWRAIDGLRTASTLFAYARRGGVTSAVATPSGGLFSGTSAWFELVDHRAAQNILRERAALELHLGERAAGSVNGSRLGAMARIREALDDARLYRSSRAAFDRAQMRDSRVSRLDLEALSNALDGTLPVIIHASSVSDIRAALALGREYNIRIAIAGGEEAWAISGELRNANVPVIIDPLQNLPWSFSRLGSRSDNAALLASDARLRAGTEVRVIIANNDAHQIHNLRQQAGNAISHGMSRRAAIRALTTEPARLVDPSSDRGLIAPSYVADMVLWSGDPFEVSSRPIRVWINGRQVPGTTRQDALFTRYRTAH